MDSITYGIIAWMIIPFPLLVMLFLMRKRFKATSEKLVSLQTRFEPVISMDDELAKLFDQINRTKIELYETRNTYKEKKTYLDKLLQQIAIYDERISFAELGLYEPHFDFGDSEKYKEAIQASRKKQKEMVSKKQATICPSNWTVDGSAAKGKTMINRQTRLTMRAFNNECEAAIANTRWNNVLAMEKRITNSAKQINSSNDSMNLFINQSYINLKLEELHLTHEYREQLKREKEDRSELARAEREEKRLLAEAKAADQEEKRYQALLDKARKEVGVDQSRIAELEAALAEAHELSLRARAMAEMTKSGYVYVISNIGSFGEDVVKIGLTRRLDPNDRVKELGDASVPFGFDTHAMIYSEEAPALETALHKKFSDRRVNESNMRKEFFRVSLEEVEEAVKELAADANFFRDREAQEWYETLARRNQSLANLRSETSELPAEI